jgi:hypothetical protein
MFMLMLTVPLVLQLFIFLKFTSSSIQHCAQTLSGFHHNASLWLVFCKSNNLISCPEDLLLSSFQIFLENDVPAFLNTLIHASCTPVLANDHVQNVFTKRERLAT